VRISCVDGDAALALMELDAPAVEFHFV
jgi:hypothetical protein